MRNNILILLLIFTSLLFVAFVNAQEHDYGAIGTVEITKQLGKSLDLSVGEQLRFNQNASNLGRSKTWVELDYTILKRLLSTSLEYDLLYYDRADTYAASHRVRFGFTVQQRFNPVRVKLRTKMQATWRDKYVRDNDDNPRTEWRNKLTLDYNFKKQGLRPYISGEIFMPLNGKKSMLLTDYRTSFGVKYRVSKASILDFYVRYQEELNKKRPDSILYGGIGWGYKF